VTLDEKREERFELTSSIVIEDCCHSLRLTDGGVLRKAQDQIEGLFKLNHCVAFNWNGNRFPGFARKKT
jgi:hypothetical protein